MKPIMYVSAVLMISAGIFGLADFQQTSRDKKFTDMYQEEKEIKTSVTEEKVPTVPVSSIEKKQQVNVKTIKPKTDTRKREDPKLSVKEKEPVLKTKKPVKRKTISTKIFSRAPIRKEFIYIDSLTEIKPVKPIVEKREQ